MADWYIVGGTVGFPQNFAIEMPKGTIKNLSGYTLTIYVWKPGASTALFSGSVTPAVEASGTCYYTLAEGNAPSSKKGEYIYSIRLVKGSEILYTVAKTVEILEGPPV